MLLCCCVKFFSVVFTDISDIDISEMKTFWGLTMVFISFNCFKKDFLIKCLLRTHIYIIEENEIKPNFFLFYNTLKVSFNLPKSQQQRIMF